MKIILLKDTPKVGKKGDVKDVSDGYALNVLIPSRRAEKATPEKIALLEKSRALASKQHEQHTHELIAQLKAFKTITLSERSNESGSLFKSVTVSDIATALQKRGVQVSADALLLDSPIKKIGTYTVQVKVDSDHTHEISIQITSA